MTNPFIPYREKNIAFIGFMGSGKTTVGEIVAKKLCRNFIDIDKEIEKEYKMPTSQIFQTIGEKAFREKEKQVITNVCKKRLQVISLGGGAFLQEEIRKVCAANCIIFFLDISWDNWKDRINSIIDTRPVLQGKSIEDMKALFFNRQEIYSIHNSKFNTDNMDAEEIADYIIDSLKLAWDLYEPQID